MTHQPELSFVTHRNHYLFSDYYLDNRVAERREWRDSDAQPAFDAVSQLWQARRSALLNANEAQTESDWIRPVLDLLGHFYTTQVSLITPQGNKIPDYILCPDDTTRIAVQTIQGAVGEADLHAALAVADAKAWEQPLDRSLPGGGVKTLHQHPALQIDFYIRHSGLAWGVLTNGRLWQLYHKDTSKKLDVYYEVDLPALIEAGDVAAFKYFWLFFRREAFVAGSAAPGAPAWLDLVLAESAAYEQGVSDSLKEQVYEALRSLAQGFLDFPGNGLTADAASLQAIHDNSLIVLYRLLFILYAEDRDLLPVRENTTYRESYSLQALKRRIAMEIDRGQPAAPTMSSLWQRLTELWRVIDSGDPFLGVPAYNGGLFKPANHPFLETTRVGDLHLRSAIDLLARARDPKTGTREVVDYRDLEIRHLGSIYEGLLEYQVRVASEPLAVRKVKGKEVYEAISESPSLGRGKGRVESSLSEDSPLTPSLSPLGRGGRNGAEILPGQVYLVTDKGERKATGSYYTPDYIVQYIVEHTVGPVLEEAAAPFVSEDGAVSDPGGLARAALDVNILDPAMGSGHFLVAAVDYVARFLVEKGAEEDGKEGKEGNGESQLAYWRRRVAQACIYGVDLNPLAVELAKLSLWLATVSKNKPLSFLDHHLRCGNSLIGARVADLPLDAAGPTSAQQRKSRKAQAEEAAARAAGQTSMLDDSAFAGSMRTASRFMGDIERLGSETLADVHESERIYVETVRKTTERARRLADLWTAQHFGLGIASDQWPALARHVLHGGGIVLPGWAEIIEEGQQIAVERRFLHWELEFPEVFFDQHGRLQGDAAGFDAVIGNPPYISANELKKSLSDYEKPYWRTRYASASGAFDIYVLFIELGLQLVGNGKLSGMITPNKYLAAPYAIALRQHIVDKHTLQLLFDVSRLGVFSEASVYPVISVFSRGRFGDTGHILIERAQFGTSPMRLRHSGDELARLPDNIWGFLLSDGTSVVRHICEQSDQLKDVADVVASSTAAEADRYSNVLREEAEFFNESGMRVINTGLIDRYHSLWGSTSLTHQGRQLEKPFLLFTRDVVPERRQAQYKSSKLIFAKVALQIEAVCDFDGIYASMNTNFAIAPKDSLGYLCAVCNSMLITWVYEEYFGTLSMSGGYMQFQAPQLSVLPIRKITFTTLADERERLAKKGRRLYGQFCDKWDYACVLGFVEHQLAQEPERADVVHDLLAFLAEQMIALNKQRQKLEKALDPFKFLDRNAPCKPFTQVFAQAIKYGELVDPGAVRHDVEGLRLVPLHSDRVELQAHLKQRDRASGWSSWQYEEDGKSILRSWTPVYRFDLDPAMARFYTHALPVLDQFTHAGKFPGGKTKSTMQKLQAAKLPVFDPAIDLTPLEELTAELEAVRTQIDRTDRLIDQVVYRLYGLTEEEIAVVEGRGEPQST
ncbi:MAG: Eco57I restriction-modification methylase domain-containing protein [Anaerolineales bacterium]|nr:Eco57I restriction-modification methylase domain-containing protein [Anaerolineales bacterium]